MKNSIIFPYYVCKIISTQADEKNGIKIYAGQAPIFSFINIPDDENVRRYTGQVNEKAKKSEKYADVHRAIRDTLDNNSSSFPLLNNGITLVATKVMFSTEKRENILNLFDANIINGSQTRGEIKNFLASTRDEDKKNISVKFEIIETQDKDLMSDISIARNTQIRVEKISIMGKEGMFDELESAIGGSKLKKAETDEEHQHLPTEKLLQVIATLIPKQLWQETENKDYAKAPYYSGQSRALNLYKMIYEEAKSSNKKYLNLYKFYLDIAEDAWTLYGRWIHHAGFDGIGIRNDSSVGRSENSNIVRVYDGLVFPIVAAHALFIQKENGKWRLKIQQQDKVDKFLIDQAKRIFQELADSKAEKMGKDQRCYSQLYSLLEAIINNPLA